jgi:hypothetical protein
MSGRRILGCALAVLCAVCAAPLLAGSISAAARPAPGRESLRSGRLSAADAESLTAARERLIGNCMRRHSLGYLPFRQDDFTDQLFPLVLTSVRWARKYGFGGGASAVLPDPNGPRAARLSGSRRELYYQALDGRPAGPSFQVRMPGGSVLAESASGCHTGAQRRLYGSAADWFGAHALASVARGTVIGEVERAGRFQAAVTVWRWCMERRGLNYPSPQAAEENATTPGPAHGHSRGRSRMRVRNPAGPGLGCSLRRGGKETTRTPSGRAARRAVSRAQCRAPRHADPVRKDAVGSRVSGAGHGSPGTR